MFDECVEPLDQGRGLVELVHSGRAGGTGHLAVGGRGHADVAVLPTPRCRWSGPTVVWIEAAGPARHIVEEKPWKTCISSASPPRMFGWPAPWHYSRVRIGL